MVGPPRPLQKDQAPPGGRAPPRHKRRPGRQESWAGHRAITLLSRACEGAGGIRSGIDPDDVPLLMLGFLWRIDPSGDWETRAGESMSIRPPIGEEHSARPDEIRDLLTIPSKLRADSGHLAIDDSNGRTAQLVRARRLCLSSLTSPCLSQAGPPVRLVARNGRIGHAQGCGPTGMIRRPSAPISPVQGTVRWRTISIRAGARFKPQAGLRSGRSSRRCSG